MEIIPDEILDNIISLSGTNVDWTSAFIRSCESGNKDLIITTMKRTAYCCDMKKGLYYACMSGNQYAVDTGKLAPTGWKVPTDAEFTEVAESTPPFFLCFLLPPV